MWDILVVFIAGFLAAAVGSMGAGGGATIGFLALVHLGLPVPLAIGTNKFADIGLHPLNIYAFARAGKIDTGSLRTIVPLAIVGSAIGALIVLALDERTIEIAVATLLCAVFVFLLARPSLGIGESVKSRWWGPAYFLSEIYAGFFGAASGVFATISLLFRGLRMGQAAATMFAAGVFGALVSFVVFAIAGLIDYRLGIPMFAGNVIGGWAGSKVAIRYGDAWVRGVVLVVVALTVVRLLW